MREGPELYILAKPRQYFLIPICTIFPKKWQWVRFYANNAEYPVDVGDGIMIPLVPSNERNLSRLWDGSELLCIFTRDSFFPSSAKGSLRIYDAFYPLFFEPFPNFIHRSVGRTMRSTYAVIKFLVLGWYCVVGGKN